MLSGMKHGVSLFANDRGILPAVAARLVEERGFDTFYVPEHSHIPIDREAIHPATQSTNELPDDRYMRTLDPWVALATACQVTERITLSTSVALPTQSDPITLAKTIATLDFLSGGRVELGVGFGWNTDELAHHGVPANRRRGYLREWLEAMTALWTQDEASYEGEYVSFKPSWAWPKPVQSHIPVILGAQAGPKTFAWIAAHADGWVTTPIDERVPQRAEELRQAWADAGRSGAPVIKVHSPKLELLSMYRDAGVDECVWGMPDADEATASRYLDELADQLMLADRVA